MVGYPKTMMSHMQTLLKLGRTLTPLIKNYGGGGGPGTISGKRLL